MMYDNSPDSILKVYDLIKPFINLTPLIKASDDFDNLFNTKGNNIIKTIIFL